MSKSIWFAFVSALVIVLLFVGGRFWYYGGTNAGSYTAPNRPLPEADIGVSATTSRLDAVDNPDVSRGVVVVDLNHDNALFVEELNVLFSKIVGRGFSYELVTGSDEEDNGSNGGLADKLRYARALILPLPRAAYSPEEVAQIERFVEKGGRLLLIGDPTRTVAVDALNSVAGSFDIIYPNDYLYNLDANDNNYRNVIYSNFVDSPITVGLDEEAKVVFYSGSSVSSPGNEIVLGDETTYSSISEGGRAMAAAALTTDDQVLALGDLTFFTEPYSAVENNGTLINNIADFLTGGQREFELADFPYFLNPNVDIVFDNSLVFNSQFEDSVRLKEMLEDIDRTVTFKDQIGQENDVIFFGRFDQTEAAQSYLDAAGIAILDPDDEAELASADNAAAGDESRFALISDAPPGDEERFVDGRIRVEGIGDLERGGSSLFALGQTEDRNVLIVLSDSPDTNADAFELLFDNELSGCVVDANLAVCQTEEPGGEVRPSLRSTRIDNILIVSDDNGHQRADARTSLVEYNNVLSSTYQIDEWVTSSTDDLLDVDQLLEYDAVIWTTGDYWDDSIDKEDAVMLARYVELGGNLILSGASIAFDWDHTDFMDKVVHADYLDFAEQQDIELALPNHPISRDFEEGAIIEFLPTSSEEPLEPDVVRHTPDARVIFQRGPASDRAGAASVIAYEDERVKIAYFAFPLYLLPPETQALLVNNTIDWFTKKPLQLPDEEDYQPFESDDLPEVTGDEETEQPADQDQTGENGGEDNGGEDTGGEDNGGEDNGGEGDGNGEG